MTGLLGAFKKVARYMNVIAGIALTFIMLLTVADVIMRYMGKPILGSFEAVAFTGAIVIGFALPLTSWTKGHIYVDFVVEKLPEQQRRITLISTRIINILLFLATGIFLFVKGMYLYRAGEVSLTLQMPFYPMAFALGVCCFAHCIVSLCDIARIRGGRYE